MQNDTLILQMQGKLRLPDLHNFTSQSSPFMTSFTNSTIFSFLVFITYYISVSFFFTNPFFSLKKKKKILNRLKISSNFGIQIKFEIHFFYDSLSLSSHKKKKYIYHYLNIHTFHESILNNNLFNWVLYSQVLFFRNRIFSLHFWGLSLLLKLTKQLHSFIPLPQIDITLALIQWLSKH